ncbi:MAG TPA: carboxypeptidase regulatory-like domain-containing protein [Longimicrobiales bacterium]|nr:carboxypeptidase regulatory-like domain-containing protein [Longimicrobiales bacterium]
MRGLRGLLLLPLLVACGNSGSPQGPPAATFGAVSGSVVEGSGQGVQGASVALARDGSTTRATITNSAGGYGFAAVETGTWTVTVSPPDGFLAAGSLSAQAQVAAGQTASVPPVTLERVEGPPGASPAVVSIGDNLFLPGSLTITAPRIVRFVNSGTQAHNTTSATGVWASDVLGPGAVFEHEFTQAGTYPYACTLHPGMSGTITVQ